jgi:hypothetical protein
MLSASASCGGMRRVVQVMADQVEMRGSDDRNFVRQNTRESALFGLAERASARREGKPTARMVYCGQDD